MDHGLSEFHTYYDEKRRKNQVWNANLIHFVSSQTCISERNFIGEDQTLLCGFFTLYYLPQSGQNF